MELEVLYKRIICIVRTLRLLLRLSTFIRFFLNNAKKRYVIARGS